MADSKSFQKDPVEGARDVVDRELEPHPIFAAAEAKQEQIRSRAYRIWQETGQQEGQADRHWEQAEREIEAEAAEQKTEHGAGVTAAQSSGEGSRVAAVRTARKRAKI